MAAPKRFKFKSIKKTFKKINNNSVYIDLLQNKSLFDECHYFIGSDKNRVTK